MPLPVFFGYTEDYGENTVKTIFWQCEEIKTEDFSNLSHVKTEE